ncbi:MAG: hypothetical protein IKZ13_04675 [Akkermansia sp.]|nr:hypothetical protein [Akkermansia sp.]
MNRALFFTVVMAALSLLSSCHCLYLTEQLDEPDRRVPIIMSEYDKTYEEAQRNFWKHKGNYYTMARVHYARERYPLVDSPRTKERIYTETEPGEYYYFPLTNEEVDTRMDLPKGSTKQPKDAMSLPPLRVNAQKRSEWQQLTMKQVVVNAPASARKKHFGFGAYSIEALPTREGSRGTARTLLLGPTWVVDTAANAAILAVEGPLMLIGTTLFVLSGLHI